MTIVEVFADVACPFTHVGLRRFVRRRAELDRTDVQLRVRAWPLEVVNGHPLAPDVVAEEVEALRREVASALFTGFDPSAFPPTSFPALALAGAAYERGLRVGEAVSLALRDALFERGVDISDPIVLGDLAREHRLVYDPMDREGVLADHAEGVARGVLGSPHFFTPTADFFCPSLDVHRHPDGRLQIEPDPDSFERLIVACFSHGPGHAAGDLRAGR